jgi:hypothetical protein
MCTLQIFFINKKLPKQETKKKWEQHIFSKMAQELKELLKAQQLIATSVEIVKSLPEHEGDTDMDRFNIHLAQFVAMTKVDLKVLKNMLLLRLKGQALVFQFIDICSFFNLFNNVG